MILTSDKLNDNVHAYGTGLGEDVLLSLREYCLHALKDLKRTGVLATQLSSAFMSNCSLNVLSADTAFASCATLVRVSRMFVINSRDPGKFFELRTSINNVSAWFLLF